MNKIIDKEKFRRAFANEIMLRQQRKEINVVKLGKDLGINKQAIYNWTSGTNPLFHNALAIAVYLNIDIQKLINESLIRDNQ